MPKGAYYNEIDPFAAEWLRQLIKAGAIAPGDVDERSIEDVCPTDLKPYNQCHFFAGIGVWSYALRCAGWEDDRPVWTGSCPCQPFSEAGKGAGFADERHLWPAWFWLISQRQPEAIFGEQVASADGLQWFDLVRSDLERAGYACGGFDLCAAGIGAPHIRQRLFFVAHSKKLGWGQKSAIARRSATGICPQGSLVKLGSNLSPSGLAHAKSSECERQRPLQNGQSPRLTNCGATSGFWANAEWLPCTDGKARAIEPGSFPLAHGASARVVCVCANCKTETLIYENLYLLREIASWNEGSESSEVLRQRVLLAAQAVNAINQHKYGSLPSANPEANLLQSLRKQRTVASSSRRQESAERFANKPGNALQEMPPSGAHERIAFDVRRLWNDVQSGQPSEPQQDLLCPVCERVGSHLCFQEMGASRVGRLRSYGNAIVAPLAKEFIAAYLDVEGDRSA